MIRKSGFILIIIIPLLSAVTLYVLRNQIVAGIAETAISSMLDTEVHVSGINLNPFAMTAEFKKITVVDSDNPAQYLIVAGPGDFVMNGLQLFAGKVVIENFEVENVGLSIPRPANEVPKPPAASSEQSGSGGGGQAASGSSSADAPKSSGGKKKGKGKKDDSFNMDDIEMPTLNLDAIGGDIDVDKLTGEKKLASLEALDAAERDSDERMERLNATYKSANFEQRYNKILADYDAINFKSKKPKVIQKSLKSLQKVSKDAQSLNKDIGKFSKSIKSDYKAIKSAYGGLDKMIAEDIASVKSLANIGGLDASNIGEMLFGREVLDQFDFIMEQLERVKTMLGSDDGEAKEEPPLRAGRTFTFPVTGRAYPAFLIENMAFSGFTLKESGEEAMRFTGTMKGLSSNARVYGEPMTMQTTATRTGKETWSIDGMFDHRQPVGRDVITAAGTNVDLGEINMGGGDLMPIKAIAKNGSITLTFGLTGDEIDGSLVIKANKMDFVFGKNAGKGGMAGSIREIFEGIGDADIVAKISGTFSDPGFSIDSSIDDVFSRRMRQMFSERMDAVNDEIRKKITGRIDAKRAEVEASTKEKMKALDGTIGKMKSQAAGFKDKMSKQKKAVEKQLKKALKKALKDKLKR